MVLNSGRSEKTQAADITALLNRMRQGDRDAGDQAVAMVYGEMHRIASREMRREQRGHTLQTTALVNEAYVRLIGSRSLEIQSRAHFFAIASQQMRRILVDFARAAKAQRRGGEAIRVDLDHVKLGAEEQRVDLTLLDQALIELEKLDSRAAQVVELRYFGGYIDREIGEALSVSLATVRRDWEYARAWLFDWMRGGRAKRPKAP